MVYVKRQTRQTLRLSSPKIKTKVRIPLADGECQFYRFEGLCSYKEHIALSFKKAIQEKMPLVAIHYGCLRSNVLELEPCACGETLWKSIHYLSHNSGILLYVGQDSCENDQPHLRNYKSVAQMLAVMEVKIIRLLSSNIEQIRQLQEQGIEVVEI